MERRLQYGGSGGDEMVIRLIREKDIKGNKELKKGRVIEGWL